MKRTDNEERKPASAYQRITIAILVGITAGILAGLLGSLKIVPLIIWDTIAVVYVGGLWFTIWGFSAAKTESLALREDPGHGVTDIILTLASIVSLVAVALILIEASSSSGATKGLFAGFGVISVILSWLVIHTLYSLKYAELYYGGDKGGIDFNQNVSPRYSDFAYLSFTIGMTFQVSDTSLETNELRRAAFHQALLSYFFGTIIIATTINLVVGLSK